MINLEELQTKLEYNPDTGLFRWLDKGPVTRKPGWFAGHISKTGYHTIRIYKKLYKASRLAWLLYHKTPPVYFIDHIDGNPLNNKIENLRDVPQSKNAQNRHRFVGKCLPGTCYDASRHKYVAQITVNYKNIHLGRFEKETEAHLAYLKAKEKYHS